jgi:hypothetical protein
MHACDERAHFFNDSSAQCKHYVYCGLEVPHAHAPAEIDHSTTSMCTQALPCCSKFDQIVISRVLEVHLNLLAKAAPAARDAPTAPAPLPAPFGQQQALRRQDPLQSALL